MYMAFAASREGRLVRSRDRDAAQARFVDRGVGQLFADSDAARTWIDDDVLDPARRPVGIEKMIRVSVPSTAPFSVATNNVAASEWTMRSTSLIVSVGGCGESWGSNRLSPSTNSGVAN